MNAPQQRTPQQTWVAEIDAANKALDRFHKRADMALRRFVDERDTLNAHSKFFNLFASNVDIMTAALYAQLPKPDVSRRFKDFDDQVGRVAGIILQRCITQDFDDPKDQFNSTMQHCVQDRLVPGLGQAWLRLDTTTEDIPYEEFPDPQPGMSEEKPTPEAYAKDPMKRIVDQRVCVDYVYWKDFVWSPCRVWAERRWVGRCVFMDRDGLKKRFGDELGDKIPLDWTPAQSKKEGPPLVPTDDVEPKACIYEIWVRSTKKVIWFSRSYPEILEEIDDPLGLEGFDPCPEPLLANVSTSNTVPRPDYYMVQDQYSELDIVNARIAKLVQACKVVGVYDKGSVGIARMLKEGFDNQLIPVDNWAMFAEKGGIKGQIDWLPLETIVAALQQLLLNRESIKQQIYELTGIADIVRGASKASETLGAQEIKAKFASVRIKRLQDAVANFAASILRIKAEIMVKHFDAPFLIKKSNIENTPDAELADQAVELLKSDDGFEWRITVTADSIAQADYDMEKADRIEFLTAAGGFIEKAAAAGQSFPQAIPMFVVMMKWAMAGFKGAKDVEGVLERAIDGLQKQPPQEKPDPEAEKLKLEQQRQQQEAALKQQEADRKAQEDARKAEMDERRAAMELEFDRQRHEMELKFKQQEQMMEMWFKKMMGMLEMRMAEKQQAQQIEASAQQHQQQMKIGEEKHAQSMEVAEETAEQKLAAQKAADKQQRKKGPKDAS